MGKWAIVEPKNIVNRVSNPSFERSADNWIGVTRTLYSPASGFTSETVQPLFGSYCGYAALNALGSSDTNYIESPYYTGAGAASYATYGGVSVFCSTGNINVHWAQNTGIAFGSSDEILITTLAQNADWQLVQWSMAFNFGVLRFSNASTSGAAIPCHIDGMHVYNSTDLGTGTYTTDNPITDYDVTYFDGDMSGAYWQGVPHNSMSGAIGQRAYGVIVNLDDYSAFVTEVTGSGMPQVDNSYSEIAQQPGAVFAGQNIQTRTFALQMDVIGTSLPDLHSKRKALINRLKLDAYPGDQPFRLVYYGANALKPAYIDARYAGGLEYQHGGAEGHTEDGVVCKFQANDPFFYEFGNGSQELGFVDESTGGGYMLGFAEYPYTTTPGIFRRATETNGGVRCMAIDDYNGRCFVGGAFTAETGSSDAFNKIAYMNIYSNVFVPMGVGSSDDVYAMTVGPDGSLYAGGNYATAVSSTNGDGIAKWSFSSSSWVALGTGIAGVVYALATGRDGYIYAGGSFDNAGGEANTRGIARWTGAAWDAPGSTGVSSTADVVYALATHPTGDIYVGGSFTTIGGVAANYIARFNKSSSDYTALGAGMNGAVYSIAIAQNGDVYAAGNFSTAGGDTDCVGVAMWNGNEWLPLSTGITATAANRVAFIGDDLYVSGGFISAGSVYSPYLVRWNGYVFGPTPFQWSAATPTGPYAMVYSRKFKRGFFGFMYIATFTEIEDFTAIDIGNSRTVQPLITVDCSSSTDTARIISLDNHVTGDSLYINYLAQIGEIATIDCATGKMISNQYGEVTGNAVLRGSNFTTFKFLPGDNYVTMFVNGPASVAVTAEWPLRHYSLDGSAA